MIEYGSEQEWDSDEEDDMMDDDDRLKIQNVLQDLTKSTEPCTYEETRHIQLNLAQIQFRTWLVISRHRL